MTDRLELDVIRLAEAERAAARARRPRPTDPPSFAAVPLFEGLRRRERDAVARLGDELLLGGGARLGGPSLRSQQWIVVVSGAVAAYRDGRVHHVLGPGDHAGLEEMLEDGSMDLGLVTLAPTRLVVFGPKQARSLLEAAPTVRRRLGREPAAVPAARAAVVHGGT